MLTDDDDDADELVNLLRGGTCHLPSSRVAQNSETCRISLHSSHAPPLQRLDFAHQREFDWWESAQIVCTKL